MKHTASADPVPGRSKHTLKLLNTEVYSYGTYGKRRTRSAE